MRMETDNPIAIPPVSNVLRLPMRMETKSAGAMDDVAVRFLDYL